MTDLPPVRHFTTSDGLRLAYDDTGADPANDRRVPLLCLSGLTRNRFDFDYVFPHLTGRRVIRLDYRGRGQSDHADPESYAVPVEGRDALELLDHLGLENAGILGTSRGGIIAMFLSATSGARVAGVCLNDIGPVLEEPGLEAIRGYVGRPPRGRDWDDLARQRAETMAAAGFAGVPHGRWRAEVQRHFRQTETGFALNYDPRLREAVLAQMSGPAADLWPLFDAMAGKPLALLRGANSDLLGHAAADAMRARRPDMLYAEVRDRGHVPFLDEPDALPVLHAFLEKLP